MKFFFDLLPVLAFFVAFQIAGIYAATAVAIATTFVQVAWLKLRGKRVDAMLWASLVIIVVFGGATLILQDETFIKWKPTVLYWMLGVVLGGAALVFRRNLIRTMLSEQVRLPDPVWNRLNWSWVGFFVFMGGLNLYVAYNYSTQLWVNFKLFGGMGLMLVFVVVQALFLARHVEDRQGASPSPSASGCPRSSRRRSTWSTRASSTAAMPGTAMAAARTGACPSCRSVSPAAAP